MTTYLYENCIVQYREQALTFVRDYLSSSGRSLLLIAGAGFDPRSLIVGSVLAEAGCSIKAILIREERRSPSEELIKRAEANLALLAARINDHSVEEIQIFADDGAVIGGRKAASIAAEADIRGVTDVVVDCSALSKGVFFPLIKHLAARIKQSKLQCNLHLFVIHEPETDKAISTTSGPAEPIHGFKGRLGLSSNQMAARLWVPQLISNQQSVLDRIYVVLDEPHDVCPVLPFPSKNPRKGDELIEEYAEELESVWGVDPRNIIYASEDGPLDIYRTLLRIDDSRRRVFEHHGGSLLILSPIGSKVTAIGTLMAAMERDFPVVNVEAVSYEVDFEQMERQREICGDIVHIWLQGDAYLVEERDASAS